MWLYQGDPKRKERKKSLLKKSWILYFSFSFYQLRNFGFECDLIKCLIFVFYKHASLYCFVVMFVYFVILFSVHLDDNFSVIRLHRRCYSLCCLH